MERKPTLTRLVPEGIDPAVAGTKQDPRRTAITSDGNARTPQCTKAEMRNRIAATIQLIANCIPDHQIVRALKDKYGYGRRHATRLMSRARKQMRRRSRRPPIDMVSDAREFYEKIIRNPESSSKEKFEAFACLRQMFGLDKPAKVAPTTPDGERPWRVDASTLSDEELLVLVKMEERMHGWPRARKAAG